MPEYVTREEFEARVGVLESEIDGEKLVTRHVLEQTRRNGDDLAAIKTRLDRVERKVETLDRKVEGLDRKVDILGQQVTGLSKSLPDLMGQVMREVLKEGGGRR